MLDAGSRQRTPLLRLRLQSALGIALSLILSSTSLTIVHPARSERCCSLDCGCPSRSPDPAVSYSSVLLQVVPPYFNY